MCIIVSKPKGIEMPPYETLDVCFRINYHGAGLMYVENGKLVIDKGYMDFDTYYSRLTELTEKFGSLKEKAVVLHFRIASAGGKSPENTHPFPITDDVTEMKKLHNTTNIGLAHNGTLCKYLPGEDNELDMSDTQVLIEKYLYKLTEKGKDVFQEPDIQEKIQKEIGPRNKITILDSNERLINIGIFIEENGVYYSNEGFKKVNS